MQLVTIDQPNHQVLREKARSISFPLEDEIQDFIKEFKEFFITLNGSGLAAPQVGVSLRIAVIQVTEKAFKVRKNVTHTVPLTTIINPSYTPVIESGKNQDWEKCYSVPNRVGQVNRYNAVYYRWKNERGEEETGLAEGFFARVLQHEIDHLNGILYFDLIKSSERYGSLEEMMPYLTA
ncbi:MAG: peptide deformylase [Proteobacteria bacterium]|nr:peptide deformylase [Pseudomonadota bacterium]